MVIVLRQQPIPGDDAMTDLNEAAQLEVISEITRLFQDRGIEHWLFGGWAVDFTLGAISRPHGDVDFVAWRSDALTIRDILTHHEYEEMPDPDAGKLHLKFSKQGQEIDVILVYPESDGQVYWNGEPWFAGAFGSRRARLAGIECPIISPESLVASKESCLAGGDPDIDREKYSGDLARLRAWLACL
jgi:hypothetical protein